MLTTPPKVRAVSKPPPFPDRTVSTTFWVSLCLGLVGLDHFYLRSPTTGIVKMLTFGGLGLWWLWDVCQLLFERERSAKYGLTAPFNLANGIGQGQLTTEQTHIRQRTDYFIWLLSALLDSFGITSLIEGRPGAFLRRLIDGAFMLMFLLIGGIFGVIMAFIMGFFSLAPAVFTLMAAFDPARLAEKGVSMPPNLMKLHNFFESWTVDYGQNTKKVVSEDIGLSAVDHTNASHTFAYEHEEKLEREQETASTQEKEGGDTKPIISWPASLLVGSIFGGIFTKILGAFSLIPFVKELFIMVDGYFGLVRASKGEIPDIPAGLTNMIPGIGKVFDKVKGVKGAIAAAEKGLESVKGVTGGLKKEASEIVGQVTGGLEQSVSGLANQVTGGLKKEASEIVGQVTGGLEQRVAGLANQVTSRLSKNVQNTDPTNPPEEDEDPRQVGGARIEPSLSTESLVLGATVLALIAGGAIKMTVDSLVSE